MVQNKLALLLSRKEISEDEISILSFAGIKDVNPICYKNKGSMRTILNHNPENVIIIWDEVNGNSDVRNVLRNEGYEIISYNEIKEAVGIILETQIKFEGKKED